MPRLQCLDCGYDDDVHWADAETCPSCGCENVRIAARVEDLPDDLWERIAEQMRRWLEENDDDDQPDGLKPEEDT